MFNLIKMNLYRMTHAVSTWVIAIVTVLYAFLQFGALKLMMDDPLHMFDGFRREGFPMRINIWGEDFHWVDPKSWPWRLQHNDYNPAGMGWLIMM